MKFYSKLPRKLFLSLIIQLFIVSTIVTIFNYKGRESIIIGMGLFLVLILVVYLGIKLFENNNSFLEVREGKVLIKFNNHWMALEDFKKNGKIKVEGFCIILTCNTVTEVFEVKQSTLVEAKKYLI